jgi:hypothetical protein|tara:strand:- start:1107 stop:1331 length:225 start_codon:yes stop_codon:yes gene_type:complete
MKRLGNNFDEWEREADRLQGMGINIRADKGLDDQSHLYKDLIKKDTMTGLDVALTVVFFILPLCLIVFLLFAFG